MLEPVAIPRRATDTTSAERQRRYRERNREAQRRFYDAHKPRQAKHRQAPDDIGPAIAEGEPFVDNFDWCESEWARLMAGARFADR